MRRYVLPRDGNFYKANLHCHSTCSDGRLTPKELKGIYKARGYSILAISDHNVLIDHSDLDDSEFVTLTSCEINVNKDSPKGHPTIPCYHINFYAEDQHNDVIPCFDPVYLKDYQKGLGECQKYVGESGYTRDYGRINEMIAEFTRHGFIATVNHPTWSQQTLDDYRTLEGVFAMEIYNNGCYLEGYDEFNAHILDGMLRMGKRIFCVATDDDHNKYPLDSPSCDSFGGFVMIKAHELTHASVISALRSGDFYASTGPEIKELYIEGDVLHIKTSDAVRISVTSDHRRACTAYPPAEQGEFDQADIDISKLRASEYIRVTVTDKFGKYAWSQPIWKDN
ncbi:MAG: PHP domain-containing protein [Clostridia bacterium]|nr:PHP domain-containing protein [Clostridia bacterium]